MWKKLIVVLLASISLGGCVLTPRKSAIEISSYPIAKVYLNGKEMGITPYKNTDLTPGEIEIKLTSGDKVWNRKITLQNNVNTVIDWEFENETQDGGGYILYLEKTGDSKKAGFLVNTTPDQSTIMIDDEVKGLSPVRIGDIGEGDQHLVLSFPGYKNVEVFMKAMKGYQLVVNAVLPKETINIDSTQNSNSSSDSLSNQAEEKVKIKKTETGWLRVRETPTLSGKEVVKVKTNEQYTLLDEQTDWIKIDLGSSKSGWVSSKYVEKIE